MPGVMPLYIKHLCIVLIAASLSGCGRGGGVVDSQKARAFSDSFMDALIHDKRDAMYSMMEPEFHGLTSRQQFDGVLNTLHERAGKPIGFQQVGYGPGVRVLYSGQTKPTCEVVYSVNTTKGPHTFNVRVVNHGNDMAVTLFTFRQPG
jgi:hypothetical protein